VRGAVAVGTLVLLILSSLSFAPPRAAGGTGDPDILRVGTVDEMKTRNVLAPWAGDSATEDILARVYESVVLLDPSDNVLPYIAKGVDANEDGTFDAEERGVWLERTNATPLEVTAYYDFNGVRWHDDVQVTVWDLLFSYHVGAMHPRQNVSLQVLFCAPRTTYDACGRQLGVRPHDNNPATPALDKNWEDENALAGQPELRVAMTFTLNEPFVRFAHGTLAPSLLPMHVWSRTGAGRHADFGCAIWIPETEADAKGIPDCASSDPARWGTGIAATEAVPSSNPFAFSDAASWAVGDLDVLGHGPFRFSHWTPGVEVRLERFEGYAGGLLFDPLLEQYMKRPSIHAIQVVLYGTHSDLVTALRENEIDYILGWIPSHWLTEIQICCSSIGVETEPEPGFGFLAYNMRRAPWGSDGGNASGDVGYWLRQAFSHIIDRKSIVQNLLANFAVVAYTTVTPANTFWHNGGVPTTLFDPTQAAAILDSPSSSAAGIGPDPPGDCSKATPAGCRSLPVWGASPFEVLSPTADVDPLFASVGAMLADGMRRVGINANARLVTIAQMIQDPNGILSRGFDMYVGFATIRTLDPDYHYAMFHSANARAGDNHAGVTNATLDALIEGSRRETDRVARQQLVRDIQQTISEVRPLEVLYYRTGLQAYRVDRFWNWASLYGTLWNYWSLIGVRAPRASQPRLTLSVDSTSMFSEGWATVTAQVRDPSLTAVDGATIRIAVSQGTLSTDSETGSDVTGVTDLAGFVKAELHAPAVTSPTYVVVTATVWSRDYVESSSASYIVSVYPKGIRFLSLSFDFPVGDIVSSGSTLPMTVLVRDEDGTIAWDAKVSVESLNPQIVSVEPSHGSAREMQRVSVVAAPDVQSSPAVLRVKAEQLDFETSVVAIPVFVLATIRDFFCPDGSRGVNGTCPQAKEATTDLPIVLAVGLSLATISSLVFVYHLRKAKPPNR